MRERRRTYGAPVAAVSMSVEGETAAYAAAVVANGGTVSDARVAILNTFIRTEKASGAWALTDDYWGLWAENEAQALTSVKQRRLAVAVGSPTFAVDRGYTFNGSSQYLDTGFILSTHGVNGTGTNQRLGVYERTNVSASGISAGTIDAAARCLLLVSRNGTVATGRTNAAGVDFTLGTADSRGLKVVSRAGGGTTMKLFDRGVKLTDGTATSPGSAAPTRALYIGAGNNAGTAASHRAASTGFAVVGGPLSDAQELAHSISVQSYATAVGANV
jgi:hypothetical protein